MTAASSADVTRVCPHGLARRLARALATLATCFCLSVLARAQTPAPVAQLELAAPDVTEFILRGTIPVPPNTFPRPDGRSPFKVLNHDGSVSLAQCEIVTRYPDESLGADVVEVLARVRRDANITPGTFIRFDVFLEPNDWRRPRTTAPVQALRTTPFGSEMRTRDCFGNLYRADLRTNDLGYRQERYGREVLEERRHTVLRPVLPVSGPTATLPHMMGVHAYMSTWSMEDVVTLDLRIHNAMSGLDKTTTGTADDAQKQMYFDALELRIPSGWTVVSEIDDPWYDPPTTSGSRTVVQLVKPRSDGTLHVIGEQAQFERRIALCPIGFEARAREFLDHHFVGFCRAGTNSNGQKLWSWWNPQTARYYPQRHLLPLMPQVSLGGIRSKLHNDLVSIEDALAHGIALGSYPIHEAGLGWAHPWGVAYGGMTSGSEIFLYDGFPTALSASREGLRYTSLRHRMYTCRMPDALFNMDGTPTRLQDWIRTNGTMQYVPSLFFQTLLSGYDMFGFDVAPNHQVTAVAAANQQPDYENALFGYMPIDLQHLGRYLNSPKTLAWLTNDAMAKDDVRMQAEIARLSFHHLPTSASGTVIVSGMLAQLQFVASHPAIGFSFGRGHGWSIDAMCAAYSLGDSAWRAEARDWFDRVVGLVEDGQAACTGVLQATISNKFLLGLFRARQSIEQAIVENGLWSMRESVYIGADPVRLARLEQVLVNSLYSMVQFPGWNTAQLAPRSVVAIGPTDVQLPLYCTSLPLGGTDSYVDRYQTPSSFAYGWYLTGDTLFLERAIEMQNPAFPDLYTAMHSGGLGNNIENKCAAMALSEVMNYP